MSKRESKTRQHPITRFEEPVWGKGRYPTSYNQSDKTEDGRMNLDYAVRLLRMHIAYVAAFEIDIPADLENVDDDFRDMDKRQRIAYLRELKRKANRKAIQFGQDLHTLGPWIYEKVFDKCDATVVGIITDFRDNIAAWGETIPQTPSFETIKAIQKLRWSTANN